MLEVVLVGIGLLRIAGIGIAVVRVGLIGVGLLRISLLRIRRLCAGALRSEGQDFEHGLENLGLS
jgi:hypothetical protein